MKLIYQNKVLIRPETLTDFEQLGSTTKMNLSDGHATQNLSPELWDSIGNINLIWQNAMSSSYNDVVKGFTNVYSDLACLKTLAQKHNLVVCPTASNSIDIVGAVLGEKSARTVLVEPTFDNLALLLSRRGVPLESISDRQFSSIQSLEDCREVFDGIALEALFLVSPNNPTGSVISEKQMRSVAQYCAEKEIILILDNSFRLQKTYHYDDYAILHDCGVSFISIEDTGKVWPTMELKISLMTCSDDLWANISLIYNEIYLCASKFSLKLIECLMRGALTHGLDFVLWNDIATRRSFLAKALYNSPVMPAEYEQTSTLSVSWLDISKTNLNDLSVTEFLWLNGIAVLPGRKFFWKNGHLTENQKNIRVSLLRPTENFHKAIEHIGKLNFDNISPTMLNKFVEGY